MKHWSQYDRSLEFNKKLRCCNNIFTFDIETTTLFKDSESNIIGFDKSNDPDYYIGCKRYGIMYIWMLSIDDDVYYGRSYEELYSFIDFLRGVLMGYKAIMYVHNLNYEFQYLRNIFNMTDVFARKERSIMNCRLDETSFELRCSSILSGMSLDRLANEYNLPVKKLNGQLDYNKLRHEFTPLTEEELEYCEHDCLIIYEFIKLMIREYGHILFIPPTLTSRLRRKFKEHVMRGNNEFITYEFESEEDKEKRLNNGKVLKLKDWRSTMSKSVPKYSEFTGLLKVFLGGYIHANEYQIGRVLNNITSIDFASAYPYVLLTEKMPKGKFSKCTKSLDELDFDKYAYIMKLKFTNITSKNPINPMSMVKCSDILNGLILGCEISNSGKLISAREVTVSVTELDYMNIVDCYTFDSVELLKVLECFKGYINKSFATFIGELYYVKADIKEKRRKIKCMYGEESEAYKDISSKYSISKTELNSLFGMCVTNYITDDVIFEDGTWSVKELTKEDIKSKLEKQEKNRELLLPYQWGVWTAAYNRRNLIKNIIQMDKGLDFVYADTDSIKYIGNYDGLIQSYNNEVDEKVKQACHRWDLNYEKMIGIGRFEFDGHYQEFKTLGPKRYAYREDGVLHLTLSGVNKETGVSALKDNINNFNNELEFGYEESGKLIVSYNDNQDDIEFTDYLGNPIRLQGHKYGVSIYPGTFHMNYDIEMKRYKTECEQSVGIKLLDFNR